MRILYINALYQDYLADAVLVGLKRLPGVRVEEYPGNRYVYADVHELAHNLYGRGFTVYGNLDPATRLEATRNGKLGLDFEDYDLIILACISQQMGFFLEYQQRLSPRNTIVLDGSDSPALFPYNVYGGHAYRLLLPRVYRTHLYFKRELMATSATHHLRGAAAAAARLIPPPPTVVPVAFGIPAEKIVADLATPKTKDFPEHIVDPEVAAARAGTSTGYLFDREEDYYQDMRISRFGITTKKGGWDCMRHYEIAAAGAVVCFRNLPEKPVTCAPHGLHPGDNCLSYTDYPDLQRQIDALDGAGYRHLQAGSWEWAKANTCTRRAEAILRRAAVHTGISLPASIQPTA